MPFRAFPVLALVLAALAGPSLAQREEREEPAPHHEPSRSELPESVLRAERETGGQVLRAESMQRDGREVYRLKVLTPDGRVRIMRDDPRERRREAWRESRRADNAPLRERDEPRFDDRPERREAAPAPPPADLAIPETLPPVERGDRY